MLRRKKQIADRNMDVRMEVEVIDATSQEIHKKCLPWKMKLEMLSTVMQGVNSPMKKPRIISQLHIGRF